jgi:hypothetical protein
LDCDLAHLTQLTRLGIREGYGVIVGKLPSSLRHMHYMRGDSGTVYRICQALPSQLTYLCLGDIWDADDDLGEEVLGLCETLTTLHTLRVPKTPFLRPINLSRLTRLQFLECGNIYSYRCANVLLSLLPPSIRELHIHSSSSLYCSLDTANCSFASLPNLNTICASHVSFDEPALLEQLTRLTTLRSADFRMCAPFSSPHIAYLLRTTSRCTQRPCIT